MADDADFIAAYPEFAGTDSNLRAAKMAAAVREIDASACGTLSDDLIYALTARKLALSPTGDTSKLVNKDGSTVYDDEIKRLRRLIVGPVVAP